MNEKYTTEECLQEYYDTLEGKLKEKEAMIDWLADTIALIVNSGPDIPMSCPIWPEGERLVKCKEGKLSCSDCWKEKVKKEVKKNA